MTEATETVPALPTEHTSLGGVEDRIGLRLREPAVGDRLVQPLLEHGAMFIPSLLGQPLPNGGQRLVDPIDRQVELLGERLR
ncbi:MAG TPA: hypothetical protein VK923_11710 [Euzebyales bacterium]|nr:hypothetical protein [Euzebyales bacterium]